MTDPVIDISHWQSKVDLQAAKDAGVLAVLHKCTEGWSVTDDTYADRRQAAAEVGLLFGAYHFLRPGHIGEQAKHFVDYAGDVDILAADHEDDGVSLADLKTFLREVSRLSGKDQLVVYSGHVLKQQLGNKYDEELSRHRLWVAHYTKDPAPEWPTGTWPSWWLWQYTDKGTVPGISGNCDCNRYDGTPTELFEDWTGEDQPDKRVARVTITVESDGPVKVDVIKVQR